MTEPMSLEQERKLTAAVDLLGRTGASGVQIRYSDDESPVVWFVVAEYGPDVWETAAGRDPVEALIRCASQVVDGGTCRHCNLPAVVETDWENPLDVFANRIGFDLCAYTYDPELATFRRSCEGTR